MLTQTLLTSTDILKFFISTNKELETGILCGGGKKITTTDHALYEALGSIKDEDNFNWRRLVKFLENVKVISYENVNKSQKPILTEKKVEEIRKTCLLPCEAQEFRCDKTKLGEE